MPVFQSSRLDRKEIEGLIITRRGLLIPTHDFWIYSSQWKMVLCFRRRNISWMVRENTSTCWFFQKSFYSYQEERWNPSRLAFKHRGNSEVSEYWHFLTEICLIFLSLQTFLAFKFALGDFPRQVGKESSPVLCICLYLASCCAWWQSVVLQFPCFFMKNKSTEFYTEQCSYAVFF